MNAHWRRFVEWRNRSRIIQRLKLDMLATVIAERGKAPDEEIEAVTWAQVRFVVIELNGDIRFVARNLRSRFGETVEPVGDCHLAMWNFEQLKKLHAKQGSVAYRLFKLIG